MKQNWQQVCRARRGACGACGACWGRGKAMKLKRNQKETTATKKRDGNSINNSNKLYTKSASGLWLSLELSFGATTCERVTIKRLLIRRVVRTGHFGHFRPLSLIF